MKITVIGPAHPLRGGIADTNEALCRALIKAGHEASLVSFSLQYPNFLFPGKTQFSADPAPEGLPIRSLLNSVNPISWITTGKLLKREKPDLVIIRYWLPFMAPCLGTVARLLDKNTKVIGLTDNVIPHEHRLGDKALTGYFTKACDGFIAMSRKVEEELKEFSESPTLYMPHPINDQFGEVIPKENARRHLKLDVDGKYLLFFGLIRKYKGLDLLLEAMADDRMKDVKLIVAGEFYDDPEEYFQLIEEKNIANRIIIRNEFIPQEEIKYYFSACDMVAQTYHTASQSGITPMAYHFGCPMLVTNVGGLSETVPHGKVGYVVERNKTAIADAIDDFFQNQKASIFSQNVIKEREKYSWEFFVEKLVNFHLQGR